jgi:hypothetical protein
MGGKMGTNDRATHYKFKIGQTVHYDGKGRIGPYSVIALLPQMRDEIRYRIRSQSDPSLEYAANEEELKPISRTRRRVG